MRKISIFGATGSIGESTFDLIRRAGGASAFHTVAVTGDQNIARLAEMARILRADHAVTADPARLADLRDALAGTPTRVSAGPDALADAARIPADWTMSAIVGAAGLVPGMAALSRGGTLALANKESLVTAGPLLLQAAGRGGATILPVDSEHSAVFQALRGEDMASVERVIITASGGPFRDWPLDRLATATVEQARAHPNWSMGLRISIDSASMFNKALELIETREFFGIDPDRIEALVHPQSLVHALVGFADGAMMAHLGAPDMRHAIGYALNYPMRADLPVARLDLAAVGTMTFAAPDLARFPALALARQVMAVRGLSGAVFNAAKEIALDHFIAGALGFLDMAGLVEETLTRAETALTLSRPPEGLDDVLAADALGRRIATELAKGWSAGH